MKRRLIGFLLFMLLALPGSATLLQGPTPFPELIDLMQQRLYSYPVFYHFDHANVRAIFDAGQTLGNRVDVFTVIGDSNSTNGDFLRPLGRQPSLCELGPYSSLQPTIDYFSATPPREGQGNSFISDSVAAEMGFGSAVVHDPFWADPEVCEGGEGPLMCEYRLVRPSVAVIYLGQNDINFAAFTPDEYQANMELIVQQSVAQGVIPILTTLVFLESRDVYPLSLEYNMRLLDLADEYRVPLINLWVAVRGLPKTGIGADNSHLSTSVDAYCNFAGAEQQYGNVLRNLLTLQALDYLRTAVLAPEAAAG